jgi:signal transduction histidine kinase
VLRHRPAEVFYGLFLFHNGPPGVVLLWMGRLAVRRQPGNGAGWVLVAMGVISVLHVAAAGWADLRLVAEGFDAPLTEAHGLAPADMPLTAAVPLWVMGWLWVPVAVLAITVLLLVFPDGRLPGPRWRAAVVAAGVGAALLMAALGIDGWPTADWTTQDTPAAVSALFVAGGLAVAGAAVASAVALARRWKRSDAVRRPQFRVVGIAAGLFAMAGVVTYPWQQLWIPVVLVTFNALLVAYGLAIARYRLHDLEPVLGRAAVAAILSGLVGAVYITIVAGAGHLVGRGLDDRILPLVAVAVVALLIEPVRRRTRQLMDRLLYRREADRTQVLSRLAAHASTAATAEVLGEVVLLLVRSTGAARVEIWLNGADRPQLGAATGATGAIGTAEPALRAAVFNQGERFGELCLYAHAPADLVGDARQLLDDVAHALGVVLRNDRLATQLSSQLEELRASRQRLVEAHDQARRGLERDIHDGAQARLISLRLRVGALRHVAGEIPEDGRVGVQLDAIGQELDATIRSLRALARGLHPPVLEQSGIADALHAHVRDLPLPVTVTDHNIGRYSSAVEAAMYFACMEAVQNAIRHSGATRVEVQLTAENAALRFDVRDDGTGFDPAREPTGTGLLNIRDRMSALGGDAHVASAAGGGTTVSGRIPVHPRTEDR